MPAPVRFGFLAGVVAMTFAAAGAAQSPPASTLRVDLFAVRDGAVVDDLRQDELQLLEDGVPQTIDSFERVVVAPGSPRSRVFVVFVDTYHTTIEDEPSARVPLVRLLDRLLDRDDLVALASPELAAADLAFRRKGDVISDLMQADWAWARRGRRRAPGSKEALYDQCFDSTRAADRARGAEMKARWREETTLAALDDLVGHLAAVREERKAVLTISDGWQLFTASRTLGAPDDDKSSRSNRLRRSGDRGSVQGSPATPVMRVECEADRRRLALVDNSQHLRDLTEGANRANVSFYTLFAPEATVPPQGMSRAVPEIDHAAARADSLRLLADGTDGLAVLKRTAVDEALPRIVADESSYYLVTYRSLNTKLDGRFRTLSARTTRPGVKIRTRRGYRGLTTDELLSARRPLGAARAVSAIPAAAPDARRPFRIRTSSWTAPDGGTFWIVGELDYRTRQELEWTAGATADVVVLAADGTELLSQTLTVKPSDGSFAVRVPERGAVQPGEYAVQVQLRPDANDSVVLTDTARVVMPAPRGDDLGTPVVWRRGPSTGPRHVQTADARFSRSERIRLELATTVPGTAVARLLDRAGQPLQVPVQVSARPDESGQFRWIVADAVLAPLAPGQYAIDVTLGSLRQRFELTLVP
ncbi:MAG TPA: VWA domain-containing protein [Vicinamibacterales bacterium]|nr:VWA domain-containing protein [Vicinamibacterales bacterium]